MHISVQPLQNVEIIRPLGAQLGFELRVRDDAFRDHQLGRGVRHRQRAHHQFFECYSVGFRFVKRNETEMDATEKLTAKQARAIPSFLVIDFNVLLGRLPASRPPRLR